MSANSPLSDIFRPGSSNWNTFRPGSSRLDREDARPGSSRIDNDSIPFHRAAPRNKSPKRQGSVRQQRNDQYVMDTNNSSIVSKRSVEKLYYGGEPEYYRYFVNKFKRRSPLINRGYWLRMRVIEHAVTRFLAEQTSKRKVVVNLGCGYDPLPFVFLGRKPTLCSNTTFVDVDFPVLLENKCNIIEQNEQLHGLLENFYRTNGEDGVMGAGNPYLAVGCDLRNLDQLKETLQEAVDIDDDGVAILFVSEVAMAYMDSEASQALLEWTATYQDVRFCLLEQHLPDGTDHPFARTMLAHFEKLNTPLHTIGTMDAMKQRFIAAAWPETGIECHSLWELWSDPTLLGPEQRRMLDTIEPFDEWEEFALFASHYFLLLAERKADQDYTFKPYRHSLSAARALATSSPGHNAKSGAAPEDVLYVQELPGSQVPRRFAALIPPASKGQDGDAIGLHGGLGTQERREDCDTYSCSESAQAIGGPPLRSGTMCHTITRLGDTNNCILVGGRTSPDKALADCWLRQDGTWQKVQSLPKGRYRHCAVSVRLPTVPKPHHTLVVYGGRTGEGNVLDDWLVWSAESGWRSLRVVGDRPCARFGAAMITDSKEGLSGVIVGGMTSAGRVLNDFWHWSLQPDMSVACQNVTARASSVLKENASILGRFGAQLVRSQHGILLVGGINGGRMLTRDNEILNMRSLRPFSVKNSRPLFIGASLQDVDGGLLLLGGGATCFSFGTYWNKCCFLSTAPREHNQQPWQLVSSKQPEVKRDSISKEHTASSRVEDGLSPVSPTFPDAFTASEIRRDSSPTVSKSNDVAVIGSSSQSVDSRDSPKTVRTTTLSADSSSFAGPERLSEVSTRSSASAGPPRPMSITSSKLHSQGMPSPVSIPKIKLSASNNFTKYLDAELPIVISGVSLGKCTQDWTNDYLKAAVGSDRKVVVHSSTCERLDFQTKNFSYETQEFGSFIDAVERGENLYLRSLSRDAPSQKPTSLVEDFPELAEDFRLPDELAYVVSNTHSTPLRISGPVTMWLHYDVMANLLCQIRGSKRVILFPPSDVSNLGFEAGASSSSLDVFAPDAAEHSHIGITRPHEAILHPGDALFIPATWPHTTAPNEGMSVAVNCFFRSMESQKYAAGRDVYGNRDLAAYEKGRKDIAKIVKSFDDLPAHVSGFYLQRLGMELLDKAKATSASAGDSLPSVLAELS